MTRSRRKVVGGLVSGGAALATARLGIGLMGRAGADHDSSQIDGDQGHVMVQFDDFPSTSPAGAPADIMDDHDVPGLVGVVTDRMDSDEEYDELDGLVADGWEVASHTVDHENLESASSDEAREQCRESYEWIDDQGHATGDTSIIYPYGAADEGVADIAREWFTFGFGGGPSPPGWDDPLRVGRVAGHESDEVEDALDRASEEGETAIVMCHGIVEDNAEGNEIELGDFERTIERIAEDDDLEPILPTDYERLLDE